MVTPRIYPDGKPSAHDRTGKPYSEAEMRDVFKKLYHLNPDAIALMFPGLSKRNIYNRAQWYKLTQKSRANWNDEDTQVCRDLWPDVDAIMEKTKRSRAAVFKRCQKIGLLHHVKGGEYTAAEDEALKRGERVAGRTLGSMEMRRRKLGINLVYLRQARGIDPKAFFVMVSDMVPRYITPDRRLDIIQTVINQCLEGRCASDLATLKKQVKTATTAVYKMHPDRGAHASLDGVLFEDGATTLGDRIESTAFRF